MKKKLILFAGVLALMLGLCACGASEEYDYASDENLRSTVESSAEIIGSLSAVESLYYASYCESLDGYELQAVVYAEWAEIAEEAGSYVGLKDYTVTKSGKTVTATSTFSCTNRDVKITYVISTISDEVTSINVELVYTTAETMAKAALNTIMGISIVFCVLVLISLIIYSFKLISVVQNFWANRGKKQQDATAAVDAPVAAAPAAITDDLELIAVITAAIAASTGAATDSFVVRSIKRR